MMAPVGRLFFDKKKTCVLRQFEDLWNNGQVER
jgi:hypothetical protein